MRSCHCIAALMVLLLSVAQVASAQQQEVDPAHQTTATTLGGTSTGLFSTLSTRTLRRGEYTFSLMWNNIDREPGDIDINRIPINLSYGVLNRVELFFNIDVFQQTTTRQPGLLSGSLFNQIRIARGGPAADPIRAFGPASGGKDSTAFFPGTRALGGGILPVIGYFAAGIPGLQAFSRPSFYNDLPFFPFSDPISSRMSGNGLGNVTLGGKVALTDVDKWFSVGLAGILRVPTTSTLHGMSQGRGAGELDGGPILVTSQKFFDNSLRFHQNIGYIINGDPKLGGLKILDRRNELMLNTGIEWAPDRYMVFTGELNGAVFVGAGTPNLNPVNPLDLVIGSRFFLCDGRVQLGGGWRMLLDAMDRRTFFQLNPVTRAVAPTLLEHGDVNGFVISLGYGHRPKRPPATPANRRPTVALDADRTLVTDGEPIALTARASDPDNDPLQFTWTSTRGRISGSGPEVTLDTKGVNPSYNAEPVDLLVTVMVDDGKGGTAGAARSLRVRAPVPVPPPPPPPLPANRPPKIDAINYAAVGSPQVENQITDGETVRIWALAHDPDNDPLDYQWLSSGGRLTGNGNEVRLDTTGITSGPGSRPVNVSVRVTVSDGRGGTDTDSRALTVHSVKRPEASRVGRDLLFPRNSARVNNVHKAILDDVAIRLQQDPKAQLVIDGHSDRGEPASVARRRAENVKNYLVREKKIDAGRIVVRSFGNERPDPSGERARNRLVELWIVPEGAELPK